MAVTRKFPVRGKPRLPGENILPFFRAPNLEKANFANFSVFKAKLRALLNNRKNKDLSSSLCTLTSKSEKFANFRLILTVSKASVKCASEKSSVYHSEQHNNHFQITGGGLVCTF